jgi:hypothetical protein
MDKEDLTFDKEHNTEYFQGDINEFPGFFQLFNAEDPAIKNRRPWYGTRWKHAGGCDSDFQNMWSKDNKIKLPFNVLHYGDPGVNWHGRATEYINGKENRRLEKHKKLQDKMYSDRSSGNYKNYSNERI